MSTSVASGTGSAVNSRAANVVRITSSRSMNGSSVRVARWYHRPLGRLTTVLESAGRGSAPGTPHRRADVHPHLARRTRGMEQRAEGNEQDEAGSARRDFLKGALVAGGAAASMGIRAGAPEPHIPRERR